MRDINDHFSQGNSRAKFKQRIAGGAVLIIVLAIFLPFIFSHSHVAHQEPVEAVAEPAPAQSATPGPTPSDAPVKSQPDQSQPQPEASAAPEAKAASTATAVMALTAPDQKDQKEDHSMRSDQPGLTPSQNEPPPQGRAQPAAAAPSASVTPPLTQEHSAQAQWILQVGSFSQANYAQHLVSQLRARGWKAYTEREQNHLVHVYVGPVASEEEAQKIQKKVQTEFQITSLVREKRA